MTLTKRLQRQLEIQRKNDNFLLQTLAPRETRIHQDGLEPPDEPVHEASRFFIESAPEPRELSCSVSAGGLETEAGQSIAQQLERLRSLQEKSFRNSRGLVSGSELQSDLDGEIRATAAGSFLYLTELDEQPGLQPSGDDPGDYGQLVLSLIQLLLGSQIECESSRIAFLDTETTGLSGGTGTYAFLVGIGSWRPSGFFVEQFFMRDFDEEGAMLSSLEERLGQVEVIVTFNGKCFDLPLLESRFVMHRRRWPLAQGIHLDLLHPSRRLWKLRLKDCSLGNLERQVLGFEREGDVPGYLIPQLYFNYARSGVSTGLKAFLRHNRQDIKTLAELTLTVARILVGCSSRESLAAEDLFGAARYLAALGQRQQSLQFGQEVLQREGPQSLKVQVLRQLAGIHRSQKTYYRAAVLWHKMISTSRAFQAEACENLAIYYEHRAGDLVRALELVEDAIRQIESGSQNSSRAHKLDRWLHRRARLQRKIGRVSMQGDIRRNIPLLG
jgi:uncharacterized protein